VSQLAESEISKCVRLDGDNILLNTTFTAHVFGITRKGLADWAKRGAPKAGRGWWNLRELIAWTGRAPGSDGKGEASAEARKLHADADYRELKAARERISLELDAGRLMRIDDVVDEWTRRVAELKVALLSLSRKIAGQISDYDTRRMIERLIADEVYNFLEQYSREGKYTPSRAIKTKPPEETAMVPGRAPGDETAGAADS
jgi:hypothetical protein